MNTDRINRISLAIVACYGAWMGMLVTHELGHVIGAWMTGGRVIDLSIPPIGFSQTSVHPNPHELFVVWCGPIIGALAPMTLLLTRRIAPTLIAFFVGFCLIANGAYIGIGWVRRAGDAGDLLRLGTPVWVMVVFGIVCVGGGLTVWHRTPGLSIHQRTVTASGKSGKPIA